MSGYKIHILMGLPGSGKTFFAKSFGDKVSYFDLDSNHGHITTDYILRILECYNEEVIVLDGLILTSEDLKFLLDTILGWGERRKKFLEFEIHYWKEDREGCLRNDELRVKDYFSRDKNSGITIRNAKFDSPEVITNTLQSYPNLSFNIQEHKVYSPSSLDLVIHKYSPRHVNGKYVLTSKTWCNGGSWGDWRGNHGTVASEDPKEFTELDDLLTELCPEITFLQYKKICRECVTLETYEESDYYGGSTSNSYHMCRIEDLIKSLKEMNLIDED